MSCLLLALVPVALAAAELPAAFQEGMGERITCDLGRVETVQRVVLLPRPLAHGYCARDFAIRVSVDGLSYETVGVFAKPEGQQADAFDFAPAEARFVQLWVITSWERAPDGNNVQIAEFQVFGPSGTDLALTGTLAAETQEDRHPVEHGNDNNPETFWVSAAQRVNQPMPWGLSPDDVWPRGAAAEPQVAPKLFQHFVDPDIQYRPKVVWFFNSMPSDESTARQLREMKAAGLAGPAIFAYKGLEVPYLSDQWLHAVRFAADEAERLGLIVWLLDEGSYPSGFADGHVTDDFPEFRSKALRVVQETAVTDGGRFTFEVGNEPVVGIVAARPEGHPGAPETLDLTDLLTEGRIEWACENGPWVVRVFVQRLESHACRSVSGGGRKDNTHSLPDYLNPRATGRFLEVTHEAYKRALGHHLGGTVVGFFGDEPCLPATPWTDDFLASFREMKGYDLRPHLPALFGAPHRDRDGVFYDYFDVLARRWTTGFYEPQTEWCHDHGVEYTCHLCGEENMMGLIHQLDADFFASLSGVGEPGVDVIWRQIFYGIDTDFPKLGGSAGHVWGKPRVMTESFAVFGMGTTFEQMKYVSDYQLVRGVNDFLLMMWNYSPDEWRRVMHPPDLSPDSCLYPDVKPYADYVARASYLQSIGTPIAPVGVYYPTRTGWMGDGSGLEAAHRIGRALLERQTDFEWIDDNGLIDCCEVTHDGLRNLSGTVHSAFILPPCRVIDAEAADRLRGFVREGGSLVCVPPTPTRFGGLGDARGTKLAELLERASATPGQWVTNGRGRAILAPDLDAAVSRAADAVPASLRLRGAPKELRVAGRQVDGVRLWFLTNDGSEPINCEVLFQGNTQVEQWSAEAGECRPFPLSDDRMAPASTRLKSGLHEGLHEAIPEATLEAGPEARLQPGARAGLRNGLVGALRLCPRASIVLVERPGARRPDVAHREGALEPLVSVSGPFRWTFVDDGGTQHSGPLAPWSEVGKLTYSGDVVYETTFEVADLPAGRLVLDLGRVCYVAEVWVNDAPAGRRLWPPYAVDVTGLVHTGENALRIRVTNTPANRVFGTPAARQAYQDAGWFDGTYVGVYEKFEGESLPSGPLGPVRLLRAR